MPQLRSCERATDVLVRVKELTSLVTERIPVMRGDIYGQQLDEVGNPISQPQDINLQSTQAMRPECLRRPLERLHAELHRQ